VDRTVVRFMAPELGGSRTPKFIFERELSFLARLEALAENQSESVDTPTYTPRHLRRALERHIAETLLVNREIYPTPTAQEIQRLAKVARFRLVQSVGGVQRLGDALGAEGVSESELGRMLERRALASLYLDRMVAPMLTPSDAELRSIHRAIKTPFSGQPFEQVREGLRRWFVARRLQSAVSAFYDSARARIEVVLMPRFAEMGAVVPAPGGAKPSDTAPSEGSSGEEAPPPPGPAERDFEGG
jgi:hypothetical protein